MCKGRHTWIRAGLAALGLWTGAASTLWGRAFEGVHRYGKNGEASIHFYTVFDRLPAHGYAPVVVAVENNFSESITWNLTFRCSSGSGVFRTRATITATGKGGLSREEILVPVATEYSSHGYNAGELEVTVTASGLEPARFQVYSNSPSGWPAIGLSSDLATIHDGTLNQRVESATGQSYGVDFGTAYDPIDLPADWRGYSGLDVLVLTAAVWSGDLLRSDARVAILEWVHLGGTLDIYDLEESYDLKVLGFPGESGGRERSLGAGKVRLFSGAFDPGPAVSTYQSMTPLRRNKLLAETYERGGWPLQTALGLRSFNAWIIVVVLTFFAILVGPVNLFVLARSGKRHRLFLTTPLISIGTSLLLVLIILAQDRFGGVGNRMAVVGLDAEGHRAFVTQEQFSRTGVLFSGDFDAPDPLFISHVMLPRTQWTRVRPGWSGDLAFLFERGQPDRMRGDWFFSRSEQGHYLQSVRPTRARIERLATEDAKGDVVLFSNIGFDLDGLFYISQDGSYWTASGELATGRPLRLRKTEEAEFDAWWRGLQGAGSQGLTRIMDEVASRPGSFYASAPVGAFAVDTLRGIRWKESQHVLYGPVPLVQQAP
ncbi:MAG TPA: hypothetical protein VMN36_07805 [Verrucomicrobiales bacterium]|nr:hypothetical protein [Verrucomicrobiales bacterium]